MSITLADTLVSRLEGEPESILEKNLDTVTQGEFARSTAVRKVGEGLWEGHFSSNWLIGQTMNGGYAMAVAARVLGQALPHPDPLTVTGHFLNRTEVGPVRCEVEILRAGGGSSTGSVKLFQKDDLKIVVTGTYGDMARQRGENRVLEAIPADMPGLAACIDLPYRANQPFRQQMLQRMAPASVRALEGEPDGSGRWQGWLDFTDGADKDLFSLVMFADALPPPVFSIYGAEGWVPTLELTVRLHRRPRPGPLRCVFWANFITEGIVNEECLLWDSGDDLVAVASQAAKYRRANG